MTRRVSVAPGGGIALARGEVLAVILDPEQHAAGTSALLDLARAHDGEELIRAAALLAMHEEDLPAFGFVVGPLASATVLLHGDIGFHAVVDGMDTGGRGAGAHEWVERTLPGPAEWIGIGTAPQDLPTTRWWDLQDGSAPASTAWLLGAGEPAAGSPPHEAITPPSPAAPPEVALVDFGGESTVHPRAPLPPAQAPPVAEPATDVADDEPEVIVRGVRCPDDHHNNPRASYCSLCGRRMGVSRSLILVDGPRPPLGVLIVDDGVTIQVRGDMVLGRSPAEHERVVAGSARAITIEDSTKSVSRVHAALSLDEWDVLIDDLGSSNGTFLWDEAGAAWERLEPGKPRMLDGRQRIRLGDRELLFAPHHVAS